MASPLTWDGRAPARARSARAPRGLARFGGGGLSSCAAARLPAEHGVARARAHAIRCSEPDRPRSASVSASRSMAAYFAGASSDDDEVVTLYRRDLEPIVEDSLLVAFDTSLSGPRGWRGCAPSGATAMPSTCARLGLAPGGALPALAGRAASSSGSRPSVGAIDFGLEIFRSGERELDDRGIVYLRHGEPAHRIVWPADAPAPTPPSPSTGPTAARRGCTGAPTATSCCTSSRARTRPTFAPCRASSISTWRRTELEVRAREVPGLTAPPLRRSIHPRPLRQEERLRARRSLAVATQSDSWERQYETASVAACSGMRSARVEGHAAGPPRVCGRRRGAPGAAGDGTGVGHVARRLLHAGGQAVAIARHRAASASPGGRGAADGVARGGRGAAGRPQGSCRGATLTADRFDLPRSTRSASLTSLGDTLELSALLIGQPAQGLAWAVTAADTAWLDPIPVYSANDTVTVYVEAYGARLGTEYHGAGSRVTRQRSGLAKLLGRRPRCHRADRADAPSTGSARGSGGRSPSVGWSQATTFSRSGGRRGTAVNQSASRAGHP